MKDAAEAPTKTSHMQQIIAVLLRGLAGRQPDRAAFRPRTRERRRTSDVETLSTRLYLTPSAAKT